jgi:hypothetical protein
VAWIEALFPRSYIDVNRNTTEIDVTLIEDDWSDAVETDPAALNKVRLGKGLIWRMTDDGKPIYQRKLSAAEVRNRIDRCWRPYHQAVEQAINDAHARHGYSIHINCHSMPAIASAYSTDFPGLAHADFVVGDRDGSTANPALTQHLCEVLRGFGYEVSYNHPYKGVELLRRYGKSRPATPRHPGRDQPQAVHGRSHAGAELALPDAARPLAADGAGPAGHRSARAALMDRVAALVVGAGAVGLAVGRALAQAGHETIVAEGWTASARA